MRTSRCCRSWGLIALACAISAGAPGRASAQTVVNADRAVITERAAFGGSTFGDVLRVIGAGPVSGGTGTMNPWVLDTDGDALKDTSTTVSTAGAWTFGSAATFTSNLLGGTGNLLIASPTRITNAAPSLSLVDSDSTAGERVWRFSTSNNQLALQTQSDAFGSELDVFRAYRTAGTPGRVDWGSTVSLVQPAVTGGSNLGSPTNKYLTLHAYELWVDTLVAQNVRATMGGAILVSPTTKLTRPLTTGATTIYVEQSPFTYQEHVILQKNGKFESMRIDVVSPRDCSLIPLPAGCASAGNDYAYAVSRNRDGTGANAWDAGDAVVSTGSESTGVPVGFMDIYSRSSVRNGFSATVMGDRPLVYWDFNDSGPTWPSRTQFAHTASVIGSGGFAAFPSGTMGNSTHYPGQITGAIKNVTGSLGQFWTAPMASYAGTDCMFTVEAIVYRPSDVAEAYGIVRKGNATTNMNFQLAYYGATTGWRLDATLAPSGSYVPLTTAFYVGPGWHHIVGTYSSFNGGRLYVDGEYKPSSFLAPQGCVNTSFTTLDGYASSDVHLDELAIYNYELSPEQIDAHFKAINVDGYSIQYGPSIVGNVRTSGAWNGWAPRWAIGNLQGLYDYATPVYGFAAGNPSGTWTAVDATNGWRLMNGGTPKVTFNTAGNGFLTGNLTIGTSGALMSGALDYSNGSGFYLDAASGGRFRVGDPLGFRIEWNGPSSTNSLKVISPNLRLDENGMLFGQSGGVADVSRAIRWQSGAMLWDSSTNGEFLIARSSGRINLEAGSTSTADGVRLHGGTTGVLQTWLDVTPHAIVVNATPATEMAFRPATDNLMKLGDSTRKWKELWLTEVQTSNTLYPMVFENGQAKAKVDGYTNSFTCPAGQAVKGMTVELGIVIGLSCGAP
jgi:hypothetical protein